MLASETSTTAILHRCLARLRAGDEGAREELIARAQQRLRANARRMFRRFARLRAWEETDDVLQAALLRLHRSLADVRPESVRDFLNFASHQIRRTLLDMKRHYFGPEGLGKNQHPPGEAPSTRWLEGAQGGRKGPESVDDWTAFHEAVARLPDELREIVDLLWYQGLTQIEAAEVLSVSERTVRNRWAEAKRRLHDELRQ